MTRPPPPGAKILTLSVLDRLLLGDRQDQSGRVEQIHRLRDAVRRDLEAILNTRPFCRSWPSAHGELSRSILSYGLFDLQTRNVTTDRQRERLRADVEAVIRRCEPRLHDSVVELINGDRTLDRSLRFRIHGRLVIEAGGEAVVYDTQIDPASREIRIAAAERDREAGNAR